MDEAPGLTEVLSHFSVDLVWLAVLLIMSGWYGWAYRKTARAGHPHPRRRLVSFAAGVSAITVTVFTPIAYYSDQLLWVNFTGFLLLTMIAAPLLVLSAPLTLAFRVATPPGRARLRAFYRSHLISFLTFPVVSWLSFAVLTYIWQFTSLTEAAVEREWVRYVQQTSLLLVSYAFWLPALCSDPQRWRMPYPARALYVFVEMTHKGLFGGMFLSASTPFHQTFADNAPAWAPDAMTDQRTAILILWIGGNLLFMVALVSILAGWLAFERRVAHRADWRQRVRREREASRKLALEQVFRRPI